MEKLVSYKTADLMLFNNYEDAVKHEKFLMDNVEEATDKIKFYKNFKEIPVTVNTFFDSFNVAYSLCDKIVILDNLSEVVQKYILDSYSLRFPSTPGVYKLNDDCEWELVK